MKSTVRVQNTKLSTLNTEEAGTLSVLHKPMLPKMRLGQSFVVTPHGLAVEGQPSLDEWLERR
jgi:hypothetical protein